MAKDKPEITPAAEKKADELGVDPSKVEGSGSGDKIVVEDVEAKASEPEKSFRVKLNPELGPTLSVRIGDETFVGGEIVTESQFEELKQAKDPTGRFALLHKGQEVT